jgi:hypothetical protein
MHLNDSMATNSTASQLLEADTTGEENFLVTEKEGTGEDGNVHADSVSRVVEGEQIDADPEAADHLSTTPLPKHVAAQFGRSMTKAEEVLTALCGVIKARETQYVAEAISNVVVGF